MSIYEQQADRAAEYARTDAIERHYTDIEPPADTERRASTVARVGEMSIRELTDWDDDEQAQVASMAEPLRTLYIAHRRARVVAIVDDFEEQV